MYLMLFLIGLPGQFFFGVTSMTMSAVVATYVFGRLYFAATGVYFFYDSYVPIAVFLGMHLLFNDPSTSPRTELGRILYGALYGLSTCALYGLLGRAGMPTFYDKLLQVPLLNLSVKGIDRIAQSRFFRAFDPAALGRSLIPRRRNLAYMSVWAAVFTMLSPTQGVGDSHPGQWLPFWRQACMDGREYACPYLADLDTTFCDRGSGWACNEAGLMDIALSRSGEDLRRLDPSKAAEPLSSDQFIQRRHDPRIGLGDRLPARPLAPDPPIRFDPGRQLARAPAHRVRGRRRHLRHHGDPAMADLPRHRPQQQPPRPLIQMMPDFIEDVRQPDLERFPITH